MRPNRPSGMPPFGGALTGGDALPADCCNSADNPIHYAYRGLGLYRRVLIAPKRGRNNDERWLDATAGPGTHRS